ncbi:MAG: class I SAM-dependent methyltransferase [Bacillota bacterium]|nr:class I SAM-dependent methyltransferase [Bacillota bacterium]
MPYTVRISDRLRKIADMVEFGSDIIDVGTDHAYLPAYLIQKGIAKSVKASDLRPGPLRKAELTVRKFGLGGALSLHLCPGLSGFTAEDADTVIIAGMGGETIAGILSEAEWTKDGRHRLILQPMTSNEDLRDFLFDNGYILRNEVLVKDAGKLYTILDAAGGDKENVKYAPFERYASRSLLKEELAGEYLDILAGRLKKKRDGIMSSGSSDRTEISLTDETINGILELKEEWKKCRQ